MQDVNDFMTTEPVEDFLNWLTSRGVTIAFILLMSWFAYHAVDTVVTHFIRRMIHNTKLNKSTAVDIKKRQDTVTGLLTTLARVFIIIIATMMVVKQLLPYINYSPIFASAGIIGVALGFGAQSLVKDFLTGLFIITENQYRVGDVVEIEGASGTVEHVGIRSTVIRDVNGNVHYLPNGVVTHVINKTMGYSKVNFSFSVEPDTDIDKLAVIINETGSKLAADPKWSKKITEAPKFLNIGSFSQFGMDVNIVGVTEPSEQWSVTGELRRRLLVEFRKNKIKLASAPGTMVWPPRAS